MSSIALLRIIESVLVGGGTGFLSGLLGIGGGFILVPLLTLVGTPIHRAVGTSLAFITCASLAGIVQHVRQGSIDLLVAGAITIPAAVMANFSARFAGILPPTWLYLLFSLLVFAVLVLFYFSPLPQSQATSRDTPSPPQPFYVLHRQRVVADMRYRYEANLLTAMLGGTVTGIVTGLFGVGGGFLMVPFMVAILHIPLRVTVGTGLAITILPALVGALAHWHAGNVDLALWLPLVVTGILSSQVGARCTVRIAPAVLKRVFLLLVLGTGLYMLVKGFMTSSA